MYYRLKSLTEKHHTALQYIFHRLLIDVWRDWRRHRTVSKCNLSKWSFVHNLHPHALLWKGSCPEWYCISELMPRWYFTLAPRKQARQAHTWRFIHDHGLNVYSDTRRRHHSQCFLKVYFSISVASEYNMSPCLISYKVAQSLRLQLQLVCVWVVSDRINFCTWIC